MGQFKNKLSFYYILGMVSRKEVLYMLLGHAMKSIFFWFGVLSALSYFVDYLGIIKDAPSFVDTIIPFSPLLAILFMALAATEITNKAIKEDREACRKDFYSRSPQARIDKAYRVFSKLYEYGESIKNTTTAQYQHWDGEAIKALTEHCNQCGLETYLSNTGRIEGVNPVLS